MVYLDSIALAKLSAMSLNLKGLAEGSSLGAHRSLLRGHAQEFSHHRPYVPGDEIKSLDWKLYARQDRFFTRQYHEETILTAHLLLDASASMGFSSREPGKWATSCRLALAMAYLVIAAGDAAGLTVFTGESEEFIPPRSVLSHIELMDSALAESRPTGASSLPRVLETLAARMRRRSLVILVSDLLGDPQEIVGALKALRARKHDVMVLQVLDPQERDFNFEGPVEFRGLEGGPPLAFDATVLAPAYREEFRKLMRLYEIGFRRSEIAYSCAYTDKSWEQALKSILGAAPAPKLIS